MKLVYLATGLPVKIGDKVRTSREADCTVSFFREPHKPSSEGHVTVLFEGDPRQSAEYYVSIIGAKWVDREDRA